MTRGRRLSDEERAESRAQDRDRLEQGARALLSSDGWQRWIGVRSQAGLARLCLLISSSVCRRRVLQGCWTSATCR